MSKYGTLKDNGGNKIYPNAYYKIGDIFITTNNENPADRFGGTWEKLPNETFLMTASSNYVVKSTGGENTVTLFQAHIPYMEADIYDTLDNKLNTGYGGGTTNTNIISTTAPENMGRTLKAKINGGGQPHNNMPKFYAVYIWIRVA